MPASISVTVYIAQQTIESINEYTIQKGLAHCRLLENHIQSTLSYSHAVGNNATFVENVLIKRLRLYRGFFL